ncbi:hypothetical protein A3I42_04190 [Candidatus Uhrbacteria bacterium RIFCSPLOWO2_02_FULL_49_11]|uniref:Uncharacterized protein n=1 Tax=Candidatus Uhrbacteria bacterium RIFCSPLOWO2_02_FULL_49_11 TaxID=1802409 RepID=A0A1F7VAN4_9BACT|nr:MAG: hypothetical protein A3I42_04190 [Candidatus Uhrbacteria bacterium RIFCSPLOWO2_02_FULL_49_11]
MKSIVRQSPFYHDILFFYDRYEGFKTRDEMTVGILKIDPSLADKGCDIRKFLLNLQITRKRQMDRFLANAVRNNPRLFGAIIEDAETVYREMRKLERKNPAMTTLLEEFNLTILSGKRVPVALQTKLAKLLYQCQAIEERRGQIGTLHNPIIIKRTEIKTSDGG